MGRLGFGRRVPGGSPGPVGTMEHDVDCRLDQGWRSLLTPRALHGAWAPPPDSPWSGFHRPTLFAALTKADGVRPLPWASLDTQAARGKPNVPAGTAVVLDLPGAWSVALAGWMARTGGFQPVVLANNWPHPQGIVPMAGMLGALLYYAPWVQEDAAMRPTNAPPVFVLDRNRLGRTPAIRDFDNRYFHMESDLPSPTLLRRGGISRVLYVAPDAGAQASGAAATPQPQPDMDDLNAWLREVRKTLGALEVAYADATAWRFGGGGDFAPAARKTVFNTVKDPAFAGFRRSAAGGFGRIIPEPSSSGGAGFG